MTQMDTNTVRKIEKYLRIFARESGRQGMKLQQHLDEIITKDDEHTVASSIVTEADKMIGRFAEEFFTQTFPGCIVVQEESTDRADIAQSAPDALMFIIDPIDGTLFYAKRSFAWTVSVGCFYRWKPVAGCIYAPQIQSLYYTEGSSSFLNGAKIESHCPTSSLKGAVMLRHMKAYHDIDDFPGYTLSYGSVALHLALVASGFACACVTSRHWIHDVAGAARILENAGAELRYVNGDLPNWQDLILRSSERAPDYFFACPRGAFDHLSQYARPRIAHPAA